MNKIEVKVNKVSDSGIFHNSRQDIRTLAKMCNILRDKCNELVDKVNELEAKQKQ